jgi:AmmeMemoRadiSam system protein B
MASEAAGNIRPPAVAGQFYPDDPAELTALIRGLLHDVPAEARSVRGAMVPHAGLIYSGACAARVLGRLALPPVVVILAPNHTGAGQPGRAALWAQGAFRTPLGPVRIAGALARRLATASDLVVDDRLAHRDEHAIEVELPFLQVLAAQTAIVPLVLAWDDWPTCCQLARDLAEVITAWPDKVLLLASSDMTHYESAEVAARKDAMALAHIERLEGEALLHTCRAGHITMCGRAAAAVVLEASRLLGGTGATVVDYRHSGLVSGEDASVVGYAGVLMG